MATKVLLAFAAISLALTAPARAGIKEEIEAYKKQKAEEEKREAAEKKAKEDADKKEEAARKAAEGPSLKQLMDAAGKKKMVLPTKSAMEDALKAKLQGGSSMEDAMKAKREETWKKDREKEEKESFVNRMKDKFNKFKDGLTKKKEGEKEKTLLDEYKEQEAKKGGSVWDMMKKKTEKK